MERDWNKAAGQACPIVPNSLSSLPLDLPTFPPPNTVSPLTPLLRNLRPSSLRVSAPILPPPPRPQLVWAVTRAPERRFDRERDVGARGEAIRPFLRRNAMAAAAAADSDSTAVATSTSTCAHCQRDIPSSNIDLHSAHCARNLQKCEHCGEMVARKLMDEHYNENHAPVNCSLCKETLQREIWDFHKSEQCPQRIVACEYCEFELPAVDLHEHQDVCGNRTEFCQPCKKYIRLREWIGHEKQCHENSNGSAESSSARTIPEREVRPPPLVRPARPAHGSQHKRLLFTIAVTGIAVMIGSILFQREESI